MLGLEICHSLKVEKASFGPHRKQLDVSFQNALFCDVDIKLTTLSKLFSLLDGVFHTPDSGKVTTSSNRGSQHTDEPLLLSLPVLAGISLLLILFPLIFVFSPRLISGGFSTSQVPSGFGISRGCSLLSPLSSLRIPSQADSHWSFSCITAHRPLVRLEVCSDLYCLYSKS